MKKFKKTILSILSLALVAVLSVAGTLAYLKSEDSDVNVMTMGNVEIKQIEQEWNDNKTELVEFTQLKPLYPYVGTFGWENITDNDGAYRRFTMANVVDKYVSVKNTGKSDAYVRTIIALEMGEYTYEEFKQIGISVNAENGSEFKFPGTWEWTDDFVTSIDGKNYNIMVAVHKNPLASGEKTIPSLLQVYMAKEATNEDVEKLDGNGNGLYDILVKSQAVQTKGFADASTALNAGFGETNAENVAKWFGGINELSVWDGKTTDTSWYNDNDKEFSLNTAAQLAGLAKLVNEGNAFDGKTLKLTIDIDLNRNEWTPIGNETNQFNGSFDGGNHTISNLKITNKTADNVGLFGKTTDGKKNSTIKNIKIHNASITGHKNVAVLAGNSFTTDVDNITITGLVEVNAFRYAGALTGYSYSSKSNIIVNVEEESYVKTYSIENGEVDNSNVGGVIGYLAEGKYSVLRNVTSNIDVYGTNSRVGGIVGLIQVNASIKNCKSTGNIYITDVEKLFVGGIAGVWMNGSGTVTLENCSFKGQIYVDGTNQTSTIGNDGFVNQGYNDSGSGSLIIK